jgi:predicted RNA-binding Zn-ribbon protein involved in translation (DUF1610 family)
MPDRKTVRIYESDHARLSEIAEATGQNIADVIAEFIREPAYICPECGDPFAPEEIEPETVEEHGLLTTGVDKLVKGQRDVKSFECPNCSERVRPGDIEAVEDGQKSGFTDRDVGVTDDESEAEFSTEEA